MVKTKTNLAHLIYLMELALLVAIMLMMNLTGLAMIPLPGQYASIMTVPVAVGAMILGPLAGGVLGGISTGQDIRVSIAVKPTPSIRLPRHSVDSRGNPVVVETKGRHDPCVGIRAVPVAEAMLALVLMDAVLQYRAQCADVALSVSPVTGSLHGTASRK